MAFVKLDCGIINSTLWVDRDAREIFITALLMAEPCELKEPKAQIEVRSLKETGFSVPPGWYGFVPAAGPGIVRCAGMDQEEGISALERLGGTDYDSRTPDFEGRRMIRIDGGYLILNYDKYRQKDHTAAERSKRYRDRKASQRDVTLTRVAKRSRTVTARVVTQAEAEAEAEKIHCAKAPEEDLKKASKPRTPDERFDAIARACGWNIEESRKNGGMIAKAKQAILASSPDATPSEIEARAARYRNNHPDWTLTPTALAKHWPSLGLTEPRLDSRDLQAEMNSTY